MNTTQGGKRVSATIKSKYGADYWSKIGKIGGKNGKGHKFAHGKIDPSTAGKLGGRSKKSETS